MWHLDFDRVYGAGDPAAPFMKWAFDGYYFHTQGHLAPDLPTEGLEILLRLVRC